MKYVKKHSFDGSNCKYVDGFDQDTPTSQFKNQVKKIYLSKIRFLHDINERNDDFIKYVFFSYKKLKMVT